MKLKLLFILLTAAHINLFAQNDNLRLQAKSEKVYINNQASNKDTTIYTYNNPNDKLPSVTTHMLWNEPGQVYVNNLQYMYTYNTNGKTDEMIYQTWDGNSWINQSRWTYVYNSFGSITTTSRFSFNNNTWVEVFRNETTFNAQGTRVQEVVKETMNGVLEDKSRNIYTVDNLQRITERKTEIFINNAWVNDGREVFYHTGNSTNVDSIYSYSWDTNSNIWEPTRRTTQKFNGQNLITEWITYQLPANKPLQRWVYDYNNQNLQILWEQYSWSTSNNVWFISGKDVTSYDNLGRTSENIYYQSSMGTLQFNSRYIYNYEADSSILSFNAFSWVNNGWQPDLDLYEYFEERQEPSGIKSLDNHFFKIYPNPFANNTTFEFEGKETGLATIYITDNNGRLVHISKTHLINGSNRFVWNGTDMSGMNLTGGQYIVYIKGNSSEQSFKLIKQ